MKIGFFKEKNDKRSPLTPQDVKKLTSLGLSVLVESDLGKKVFSDKMFNKSGAENFR